MNRAEKKLIAAAVAAIAVLLAVLLTIINVAAFTMAAEDADRVTEMLSKNRGAFSEENVRPGNNPAGMMGPMGPDSPEIKKSVRYFTVAMDEKGSGKIISYNISAVSEEEAVTWAESLQKETTGWTRSTYRYRVFRLKGVTYVTVIDQGRELVSCYRILWISVIGGISAVLLSLIVLIIAGRKLFAPIEEADRKQKQFIRRAEQEMKVPLTVIDADTEILERENGASDETASIRRQVRKMSLLVESMEALETVHLTEKRPSKVNLSEIVEHAVEAKRGDFESANRSLKVDVSENVSVPGDKKQFEAMMNELLENALRFGKTETSVRLSKEDKRVVLEVANDADLEDGAYEEAFDRFTTFSNASGTAGLGLARVREIVRLYGGRSGATVKDSVFHILISF